MLPKLMRVSLALLITFTFAQAVQAQALKVGATPTGVPFTFLDTKTNSTQGGSWWI